MTTTGSAGSIETPLKLEDQLKEEDFIDIDEELFEKMVIEKLMKEEVNNHAMTLSNKYKGSKTPKSKKEKTIKVSTGYYNSHNDDTKVERGNNGLDTLEADSGAMGESFEESNKEEEEVLKNSKERETPKMPSLIQMGSKITSESIYNKTFKFNKLITEENLRYFLTEEKNILKGSQFYVNDGINKIHIDWDNYESPFITGNLNESEKTLKHIKKLLNG